MLTLKTAIKYYEREDVEKSIVDASIDREVAIKFSNKFGPRPDVLNNPNDIMEAVKDGASSFHVSEERWKNPLLLVANMPKRDLDENRIGWDLVLDIDFEEFECSKIIALLIVKTLKKHGIKSISAKFSGNKGFHIGIPFEAFPSKIYGEETKNLFPEGPQRITRYIINYINSPENNFELTNKILQRLSIDELCNIMGKDKADLISIVCSKCGSEIKDDSETLTEFICPNCDYRSSEKINYLTCPKCKKLMHRTSSYVKNKCKKCGGTNFKERINPKIDTVLVSSRHLFRAPYSLHEKTGLASVPLEVDKLMDFKKEYATPENVNTSLKFLDRTNVNPEEARQILIEAFDYTQKLEFNEKRTGIEFVKLENALSEENFPPCVIKGLQGMTDGRKRALFFLTNFLSNCGYSFEAMENIIEAWNKRNKEPLGGTYIKGQLRYRKQQNKAIMPPNCRRFYQDLRICNPDNICEKIKNPVQYAKRKVWIANRNVKGKIGNNIKNEEKIQRSG